MEVQRQLHPSGTTSEIKLFKPGSSIGKPLVVASSSSETQDPSNTNRSKAIVPKRSAGPDAYIEPGWPNTEIGNIHETTATFSNVKRGRYGHLNDSEARLLNMLATEHTLVNICLTGSQLCDCKQNESPSHSVLLEHLLHMTFGHNSVESTQCKHIDNSTCTAVCRSVVAQLLQHDIGLRALLPWDSHRSIFQQMLLGRSCFFGYGHEYGPRSALPSERPAYNRPSKAAGRSDLPPTQRVFRSIIIAREKTIQKLREVRKDEEVTRSVLNSHMKREKTLTAEDEVRRGLKSQPFGLKNYFNLVRARPDHLFIAGYRLGRSGE